MKVSIPDFSGIIGVSLIIGTYFLLQLRRVSSNHIAYSVLNALGAILIIYSLLFEFNLSAFIIEAFWVAISLFGIIRYFKEKRS